MTINKLTLAAALTIGLMAGTMNSGIASNVDISSLDMTKLAACPISGCQADVTPSTAVCPCTPVPKDDCGCETGAAAPCPCDPCNTCAPVEPCNPCEAVAPPCDCQPVVQSVCASQCDGKSVSKQHYAYPANVYSDSQSVGSNANNVIIGESSQCGCSLCPTPGVMVSDLPTCGCNCGGVLAAGAQPEAEAGPVQEEERHAPHHQTDPGRPVCPAEEQRSDHRDLRQQRDVGADDAAKDGHVAASRDGLGEEQRESRGEHVDRRTGYDLVALEVDRGECMQHRQQASGRYRRQDAYDYRGIIAHACALQQVYRGRRREAAGEHQALDAQVRDAAAFGVQPAQSAHEKRHRVGDRRRND